MQLGDVILVCGTTPLSKALKAAQKAIYYNSKSSHVLFCLGDGCFIHSTGDGGVHLKYILEELKEIKDDWRVIRLKNIPEGKSDALILAGFYFLKQGYNKKFLISDSENSSFCSELVAKIFRRAGLPIIGNKSPHRLTPAHFDKEADRQVLWKDVTEECSKYLEEHKEIEHAHRFVFKQFEYMLNMVHTRNEMKTNINQMMKDIDPTLANKMEKMQKELYDKKSIHFWDQ